MSVCHLLSLMKLTYWTMIGWRWQHKVDVIVIVGVMYFVHLYCLDVDRGHWCCPLPGGISHASLVAECFTT